MKYELTKDLETGNLTIDREHKELFNAVNDMMDACSKGKGRTQIDATIKFLLNYVDRHFAHEEQLHQKSGFPNLEVHKQFQANYAKKLRDIVSAIPADGPKMVDLIHINQHIGVLISHIRSTDKKLGAFINSQK